jgi:hypothetical protein
MDSDYILANSRTKVAALVTNVETQMRRLGPYAVDGLAAVLILILLALSASSRRVTGDGPEYLLMTERLASGRGPAVPIEIATRAGVYDSRLIDRHGQQEMWHYWFFPLCVAPVLAVTTAVGGSPLWAFTIFNAMLLWIGVVIVRRRFGVLAAIFVGLSPHLVDRQAPSRGVHVHLALTRLHCVAESLPVSVVLRHRGHPESSDRRTGRGGRYHHGVAASGSPEGRVGVGARVRRPRDASPVLLG